MSNNSHYFLNDKKLNYNWKEISFQFFSKEYKLYSSDGVFSKKGLDYGTRILVESCIKANISGNVLDYGSGIGVVSILLATNLKVNLVATDINDQAIKLTRANAKRLNLSVRVEKEIRDEEFFNNFKNVVLNPPIKSGKENVYQMFSLAHKFLEDAGCLWIVIRKDHGALSAIKYLKGIFKQVDILLKDKGFWILRCKK